MARRRVISEELIYDVEFNQLSPEAQNLFFRMLAKSDDCGVIPVADLSSRINLTSQGLPDLLKTITDNGLGLRFDFRGKPYFAFKPASFQYWQSQLITKRKRSDYLRISVEEYQDLIEGKNGHNRRNGAPGAKRTKNNDIALPSSLSTSLPSTKKVESRKQKAERGGPGERDSGRPDPNFIPLIRKINLERLIKIRDDPRRSERERKIATEKIKRLEDERR